MTAVIGIRREDKNEWETRAPLTPADTGRLIREHGMRVLVQPSTIRVYADGEYRHAGCEICEDLGPAGVILGVKEVPRERLLKGKTYLFFSHTIKGQHHNMPMLRQMMGLGCNLIDYELITNENGARLIFFGRYAGMAGMIDTLWGLGEGLRHRGIENPFYEMRLTHKYRDLNAALEDVSLVAQMIKEQGLPQAIVPVVIGFAGYGNVSRGAQEILDMLPVIEVKPSGLEDLMKKGNFSSRHVYKVVFKEKDMVAPREPHGEFDLNDYYQHPRKYKGTFHHHLPHLSVLINAIYWTEKYPRLVTRDFAHKMWKKNQRRLQIIGDISVDINGAIEMTSHTTDPGNPVYTFDPISGDYTAGCHGEGFTIMAVDNLPCELPKESSDYFSSVLVGFVPEITRCDFGKKTDELALSPELSRALLLHKGRLTRKYEYIKDFLTDQAPLA